MSRDTTQFDEDFGAHVIKHQPSPDHPTPPQVDHTPLTAGELGALLCRIPYYDPATGAHVGDIYLTTFDWQRLIDQHNLTIYHTRRTP